MMRVSLRCMSCDCVGKRQGVFFGYIWKDSLLSLSRTLGFLCGRNFMRTVSVDFNQFVDENADTIPRYTCSEILFKTCLGSH